MIGVACRHVQNRIYCSSAVVYELSSKPCCICGLPFHKIFNSCMFIKKINQLKTTQTRIRKPCPPSRLDFIIELRVDLRGEIEPSLLHHERAWGVWSLIHLQ